VGASILICDDEKNIRRTLGMVLEGLGHRVHEAASAEEALALLDREEIELAILDVRLPQMSGIDALQRIRAKPELTGLPVIMISGHASLAEAVHSVQLGATDFLEKPLDRDRVLVSVNNALKSERLQREVNRLRAEVSDRYQMIGRSAVMTTLFQQIEKVAPTKGRVLITGESGTGKELIARAIHRLSDRENAPFVMLNCAAIPAELIESELFGHERGAFTGAHNRKKGMFELADGGTLFLDEIGDLRLDLQAKLLRAIQENEIERVGGRHPIQVDFRLVVATNADLSEAVRMGRFREDLFYRINVIPVRLPALRDRMEDLAQLLDVFIRRYALRFRKLVRGIEPSAFGVLERYAWPGNIRELQNLAERMVAVCDKTEITEADLPLEVQLAALEALAADQGESVLDQAVAAFERSYLLKALEKGEWNIAATARQLRLPLSTLKHRMGRLRLTDVTRRLRDG